MYQIHYQYLLILLLFSHQNVCHFFSNRIDRDIKNTAFPQMVVWNILTGEEEIKTLNI